ncbi:PQQ-binding-like beta-propeller repeat protein [Thiomicrospira sp. ALE5]|uniref:PQQ-binding-like beta-propeller repeat protein n=1 Tax=Thiomicrospira sp. ALE5 TaxID=748650 RepID=UPI0008E00F18|nr:PQQ-binding-like beta-propeller repeat protein [Thiomicrospira sp. ALE5]SFR63205.1 Beta-barrel assembly machine subunit BamB [Thiomicrospira sp. ALE5]
MKNLKFAGLIALFAFTLGCSGTPNTLPEPGPLLPGVSTAPLKIEWRLNLNQVSQADGRGLAITLSEHDRAYVAASSGLLTAITRKPQSRYIDQVLWQSKYEAPLIAGPALDATGLYVGTAKGSLMHIHPDTGRIIWQTHLNSEVVATPALTSRKVIVRTNDGRVIAADKLNGEVLWVASAQMPSLFLRGAAPVLVINNQVFVGRENGFVEALSLANGETLWQARLATPSGRTDLERMVDIQAQLIYDQGRLFALAYNGRMAAINTQTGNFIWTRPVEGAKDFTFKDNRLFVSGSDQIVRALDASSGTEIWNQSGLVGRMPGSIHQVDLDNDSALLVLDGFGYLHWLSEVDGRVLARFGHVDHLDRGRQMLVAAVENGNYFILDRNGQLISYQLDIAKFQSLNKQAETND